MATHEVTDYGARANGTDTDTEAIQSALNACADDGGGTVVVPSGEYCVTHCFSGRTSNSASKRVRLS